MTRPKKKLDANFPYPLKLVRYALRMCLRIFCSKVLLSLPVHVWICSQEAHVVCNVHTHQAKDGWGSTELAAGWQPGGSRPPICSEPTWHVMPTLICRPNKLRNGQVSTELVAADTPRKPSWHAMFILKSRLIKLRTVDFQRACSSCHLQQAYLACNIHANLQTYQAEDGWGSTELAADAIGGSEIALKAERGSMPKPPCQWLSSLLLMPLGNVDPAWRARAAIEILVPASPTALSKDECTPPITYLHLRPTIALCALSEDK